jgi:serine/threonine-protein kinase
MVTGQLPFKGEYEQAVTYSILNEEPEPLTGLRNHVPMELERIVSKATAKEPAERYQHVDELPVDLKNVDLTSTGTSQISTSANGMHEMKKPKFRERNIVWQVIAILSIIAVVAVWYLKPIPLEVTKFSLNYDTDFSNSFFTVCPIISPDGKKILYAVNGSLYLRRSDELERRLLPGTEGARSPFFKPDGRSIGFIANNELKTMRLGAKPKPLTGMEHKTFNFYSWGYNNYIYYSRNGTWDIWRISEDGGAPENLSTPDKEKGESAHWFPEILPDGKSLLFTIWKNDLNNTQVALLDIAAKEYKVLIEGGSHARYVPTGHIVYAQSGVLMAAPFDTKNYKLGEQREPIIKCIRQEIATGQTFLSFSNTGLLIYLRGGIWTLRHQVVLVDRFGNEKITGITPGAIFSPRFSPDETKIAFTKFENGLLNIFTYDIEGETEEQITSGYNNLYGDWTPDGSKITYTTFRKGLYDIYQLAVNPRGNEEPLLTGKTDQIFRTWSPDGKIFLFGEFHPISGANIRYYDINNKDSTKSLLSEEYLEFNPSFSPDGKWLVYASNEFGQNEIFIRRFSVSGKGTPISLGGGNEPVWSKDGNEVYYKSKNKMMGVKIETKPQLSFSKPTILFEFERPFHPEGGINYDVSKDGKFLMVRNEQGKSAETVVIQNWFEELKDKFKSGNK